MIRSAFFTLALTVFYPPPPLASSPSILSHFLGHLQTKPHDQECGTRLNSIMIATNPLKMRAHEMHHGGAPSEIKGWSWQAHEICGTHYVYNFVCEYFMLPGKVSQAQSDNNCL